MMPIIEARESIKQINNYRMAQADLEKDRVAKDAFNTLVEQAEFDEQEKRGKAIDLATLPKEMRNAVVEKMGFKVLN